MQIGCVHKLKVASLSKQMTLGDGQMVKSPHLTTFCVFSHVETTSYTKFLMYFVIVITNSQNSVGCE